MARLPLSAFPESFRADLEAYLSMRANPDLFDPEAPDKPAKANTLRLYRDQLRLAANALIERGRGPNDISYLHDLVQPEAFKDIMRQLLAEHDGAGSFWTDGIIKTLLMIAKRWCRVSHDGLNELRRLARAVPKPEAGLTPKNRAALRQFDDEQNLARLLHLPEQLFREAMRENPPTLRAARKAQIAITIEFLLYCPIRIGNLLSLQLDRQILRPNGAHGPAYLCLEPEEVKNERGIDFELPQSLSKMLATYVELFLPLFGDHDGRLFVTPGGKRKSGGSFGTQLSRIIRDRTGLQLTAHQFRHLAAKLFLDAHPGGYESLRQLLGHRSIKTTIRSYAGVKMRRAAQIHDEVIEQLREELRPLAHRRCRPRPKE
jgi:integrase